MLTPLSRQGVAIVADETELAAIAFALGAGEVPTLTDEEAALAPRGRAVHVRPAQLDAVRARIRAGHDPLGEAFCRLRSAAARRPLGAVYTPSLIVDAMLNWAAQADTTGVAQRIDRIVDPGAGSGRFAVRAGQRWPDARVVAVELDPLAALLARANLAVSGLASRARVVRADYRTASLGGGTSGPTLFIGNPPYVRHHELSVHDKEWLAHTARRLDLRASRLSGLHVHFFLATALHARPGDLGAFITASEWLDVNYGSLVRDLLLEKLGGTALHLIEPRAMPFPDTHTTAAITCFRIGSRPRAVRVRRVATSDELGDLAGGEPILRTKLTAAPRWTPLIYGTRDAPRGYVELGELCRVRRGQVTGANKFWIEGPHAAGLPASVLFRTVTRARELYEAGRVLARSAHLRRVIDLPVDLDELDEIGSDARRAVDALLREARKQGVHRGYIARHRRAWWSVGLYEPAPILATYMARRPPGFVRNQSRARHINIAHGLYPRDPMPAAVLDALVTHLSTTTKLSEGRTYAGGLTKFEPKEMERLMVPGPSLLRVT